MSYDGGPFTAEAMKEAFGNHGFKLNDSSFSEASAEDLERLTTVEYANKIIDAWLMDQMDDDGEIMCANFKSTDYETAKELYPNLIRQIFGRIDLTGEDVKEFGPFEGDNYSLYGFSGTLYGSNVTTYYVCVDEYIFVTLGSFEKDKGLQFDQAIYELGILPLAQIMTGRISYISIMKDDNAGAPLLFREWGAFFLFFLEKIWQM